MNARLTVCLLLFSFFNTSLWSQQPPSIGLRVPAFTVELMNEKKILELDSIDKEKIIVIEFWATWCVPCLKAFPHFNELQEKFKNKPVMFLSVTYERNNEKLIAFLEKHPIKTLVATDINLKMFKDYAAWAIPQTLIIDKNRNLVVSIHPEKITAEIIQDVLDGKKIDIKENGKQAYFDPKGAEEYFRKLEKEGKN